MEDRTDGKLAHLDGLNFSRASALYRFEHNLVRQICPSSKSLFFLSFWGFPAKRQEGLLYTRSWLKGKPKILRAPCPLWAERILNVLIWQHVLGSFVPLVNFPHLHFLTLIKARSLPRCFVTVSKWFFGHCCLIKFLCQTQPIHLQVKTWRCRLRCWQAKVLSATLRLWLLWPPKSTWWFVMCLAISCASG